jgi:hypothetical protein
VTQQQHTIHSRIKRVPNKATLDIKQQRLYLFVRTPRTIKLYSGKFDRASSLRESSSAQKVTMRFCWCPFAGNVEVLLHSNRQKQVCSASVIGGEIWQQSHLKAKIFRVRTLFSSLTDSLPQYLILLVDAEGRDRILRISRYAFCNQREQKIERFILSQHRDR